MKLSPIYGWPIAEQDDARRDFPLTVDDPRTLAIEQTLSTIYFGRVEWGTSVSWASGQSRLTQTPTLVDTTTGMVWDGTSMLFATPAAGIWSVSAGATFQGVPAGAEAQVMAGSTAGPLSSGTAAAPLSAGNTISYTATIVACAAGTEWAVWAYCSAACTLQRAKMEIHYLGPDT